MACGVNLNVGNKKKLGNTCSLKWVLKKMGRQPCVRGADDTLQVRGLPFSSASGIIGDGVYCWENASDFSMTLESSGEGKEDRSSPTEGNHNPVSRKATRERKRGEAAATMEKIICFSAWRRWEGEEAGEEEKEREGDPASKRKGRPVEIQRGRARGCGRILSECVERRLSENVEFGNEAVDFDFSNYRRRCAGEGNECTLLWNFFPPISNARIACRDFTIPPLSIRRPAAKPHNRTVQSQDHCSWSFFHFDEEIYPAPSQAFGSQVVTKLSNGRPLGQLALPMESSDLSLYDSQKSSGGLADNATCKNTN
ncbi:hypothetical protein ACLOJK_034133 [Asimina triloba]